MYCFMLPTMFKRFKAQGRTWTELPFDMRLDLIRADGLIGYHDKRAGRDVVVISLEKSHFVYVALEDCYPIFDEPEREYLITAAKNEFGGCYQNNYASTWKEACDCSNYMSEYYDFVEILYGYPGHWERVEV